MRRREFLGTASAAIAATAAGPIAGWAASDLELLNPGVLTSATEGTYPPFSMRKPDGELDGLEMRIMGEICNRLELEYEPVIVKWDSMLVGLQAGHFDIVGNAMGITAERQKAVTFCDGWIETGARVVVRKDSAYASPDELQGKDIGAIAASTFIPIVEQLGGNLKAYKADVDGMQGPGQRQYRSSHSGEHCGELRDHQVETAAAIASGIDRSGTTRMGSQDGQAEPGPCHQRHKGRNGCRRQGRRTLRRHHRLRPIAE